MAAKKEAAAAEAVYDYLHQQNRPYSVNDIVQNLHKEHGKAAVQKALDKLSQDERVREKTYGKQKIYYVNQKDMPEVSGNELKAMDKLIEEKEKLVKQMEIKLKESQSALKAINSAMTTEEAKSQLEKLTAKNVELEAKRQKFETKNVEVLDAKERGKIRQDRQKMLKEWRQRKKMCTEMINSVMESWPDTKQALLEQAGIDTDEDAGVSVNPTTLV